MEEVQLLIGDRDAPAAKSATFERKNPISGEVASRAAAASVEDARAAADAAAKAFPKWAALGPNERRKRSLKAADLLEAAGAAVCDARSRRDGCDARLGPFQRALRRHDAARSSRDDHADHRAKSCRRMFRAIWRWRIRQPVGVVLGIAPWNAPIILGVRAVAMPLACGNTVILKASEVCPQRTGSIGTVR